MFLVRSYRRIAIGVEEIDTFCKNRREAYVIYSDLSKHLLGIGGFIGVDLIEDKALVSKIFASRRAENDIRS